MYSSKFSNPSDETMKKGISKKNIAIGNLVSHQGGVRNLINKNLKSYKKNSYLPKKGK